jgi:glycerol-3-phosphate dehydrogenase
MSDQWTAGVALPGGDFAIDGFDKLVDEIHAACPLLSIDVVRRLARAYGTEARNILAPVKSKHDLGIDFGAGIHGVELDWAIENEWVTSAEDFLWRRTRMGLRLTPDQISAVDEYIRQKRR